MFIESKGGEFERCPPGVHLARCYRVVDLGTQKSEYMGQTKYLHKIMISWEIHGTNEAGEPLRMNDGRPFAIFKNYTRSWSEKANIRLDLQSWRGRPFTKDEMNRFDLKSILGAWCMLNVIERQGQNGNTYSNINGITPVPALIRQNGLPKEVNKAEIFNLEEPDMELFNTFSENLKAKIKSSPQWQKLESKNPVENQPPVDDDVPF